MQIPKQHLIAYNLAAVLLSGVWTREAMRARLLTALGPKARKSQRRLVDEILNAGKAAYPPSISALAGIVASSPAFERATAPALRDPSPLRMVLRPPRFAPTNILPKIAVPPLATPGDIAVWLGLPIDHLGWFTDARRQHARTVIPDLQHYTYALRAKAHGLPRLIEAPKARLKTIQRRILRDILDRVPPHDAAHGFIKGRGCRSGAELHANSAIVAHFDIADFFLTTPLGRVHALFRHLGYPDAAARALTRLCSTATPASVFQSKSNLREHTRSALRHLYAEPHLPQGGPASPALANLVARRLDVRLAGLARSLGGQYSRYADDMTFSGGKDFAAKTASLIPAVTTIVEDEGYALNERKTRIMSPAQAQQITGIVVNAHPNVPRTTYDQLKAILYNCRIHGLEARPRWAP